MCRYVLFTFVEQVLTLSDDMQPYVQHLETRLVQLVSIFPIS